MKIEVEPTEDENYIKSVFLNPSIYAGMKDDNSPSDPTDLIGWDTKSVPGFFLRVLMDGDPVGAFWLTWKDDAVEAHTALLPVCRGRLAIEATKAAIKWVFDNTRATAITSYAWSDSPAVAWFCRAVGMVETEIKPWPATRDGKTVDVLHYRIGRAT